MSHKKTLAALAVILVLVLADAGSAADLSVSGRVVRTDLSVTAISVNAGAGDVFFASEPNVISVTIRNNGVSAAEDFQVGVDVDGVVYPAAVLSLAGEASTTVIITDTVSHDGGGSSGSIMITATADSLNTVPETDETNNVLSTSQTIYNNGYKGKRWTGGSDIMTQATFTGQYGFLYSPGSTAYSGASWTTATYRWTPSDLPIPDSATVVSARLYQPYTWNTMTGDPQFTVSFNGDTVTPAATYMDRKQYGSYDVPSGLYVYDVTGSFSPSGNILTLIPEAANTYGLLRAVRGIPHCRIRRCGDIAEEDLDQ